MILGSLWLTAPGAPARAQGTGAERAPKTAEELQRQSGHVWDLAHKGRVESLRPLKTKALRSAVDDYLATGKVDLRRDLDVTWGQFAAGTGDTFVAIALDRPLDGELPVDEELVLFGRVLDATGKEVASFETEDRVEAAAGRALLDLSLKLPEGTHRAIVGVADGKKPRWLLEQAITVAPVDLTAFTLSPPVLALDVHPLLTPQQPDDPYCFGGLRVAPRGNRTFQKSEEPWLFVVARVPGSDETTPPRFEAVLQLSDGSGAAPTRYPIADLTANPLRGFASQWGLGIPLPVPTLAPGEYQAALLVTDKGTGKQVATTAAFTVVR